MIKYDYLPKLNYKIIQDEKMFCLNSDSVHLGEFLNLKYHKKILDIGTNNGVQLLYASQFKPELLVGIDVNAKACQLAHNNLLLNEIENFEIYNISLQDFKYSQFDVIISNPPFFEMNKNDSSRNIANLPIDDLFKHAKRLLKSNGVLIIIHKSNRLYDLIISMNKYGLFVSKMKMIFDQNKEYAINVMLEIKIGKSNNNLIILKSIVKEH